MDNYIHRSGRTGRAGRPGVSICLFMPGCEQELQNVETKAVRITDWLRLSLCLLLIAIFLHGWQSFIIVLWFLIVCGIPLGLIWTWRVTIHKGRHSCSITYNPGFGHPVLSSSSGWVRCVSLSLKEMMSFSDLTSQFLNPKHAPESLFFYEWSNTTRTACNWLATTVSGHLGGFWGQKFCWHYAPTHGGALLW